MIALVNLEIVTVGIHVVIAGTRIITAVKLIECVFTCFKLIG